MCSNKARLTVTYIYTHCRFATNNPSNRLTLTTFTKKRELRTSRKGSSRSPTHVRTMSTQHRTAMQSQTCVVVVCWSCWLVTAVEDWLWSWLWSAYNNNNVMYNSFTCACVGTTKLCYIHSVQNPSTMNMYKFGTSWLCPILALNHLISLYTQNLYPLPSHTWSILLASLVWNNVWICVKTIIHVYTMHKVFCRPSLWVSATLCYQFFLQFLKSTPLSLSLCHIIPRLSDTI